VFNQRFVLLPKVSVPKAFGITATSPTLSVGQYIRMGKILKYFKENKFEVIISILMIISFFYKIEISIFLFGILLLKKT